MEGMGHLTQEPEPNEYQRSMVELCLRLIELKRTLERFKIVVDHGVAVVDERLFRASVQG